MELKTENRKAKNIILGILSCIAIILVICIIIAVGNRKHEEENEGNTNVTKNFAADTKDTYDKESTHKTTQKESDDTDNTQKETESSKEAQTTVNQGTAVDEPATNQPDSNQQTPNQQTSNQQATVQSPTTKQPQQQTTQPTQQQTTTPKPTNAETIDEKVNRIVSNMTLEEKVYQMFIVAPESLTGQGKVTQAGQTTKDCINKYPVGGLIYFAANIVNESQVTEMLSNTQQYSLERTGLKMFTCIDEEGGRVARIGNNSSFPVKTFPDMAYINGESEAYNVGDTIGGYLSKYGFNVDFAPCADVITNSENKVIGTRSFGTNPDIVSRMSLSVAKGLKTHGVLATYKHFPGHGSTVGDTHEGFAYTNKTLDELMQSELVPFKSAADNGIDMVMVAHISVPNVIGDDTPSSLSYKMITGVLKEQLGYKGLIVTDALNMGAIANKYSSETAAVMAVKAGNDLLLMPKDFTAAARAVVNEVKNGNISEERINESVRKIVRAKLKL